MQCPYCSSDDLKVVDSRDAEAGKAVRRRRECTGCGQRLTTFERVEGIPLIVSKRDGSREPFDRAKVVAGIAKACKNRPVTDEAMLAVCDVIEEELRAVGAEVPAEVVGQFVLAQLRELDEVAYVRFASVYKDFDDVAEFERIIAELDESDVGGRG